MNYAKLFTRRKDGYYVATYKLDGKRKYLYDRDPEALYKRLEAAKTRPPLSFGKIVEAWREEHSENVGYKTAESYVAPCRRIIDVFGDDIPGEITAARALYNDTVNQWNSDIFDWPTKMIVAAKAGYTTRIPFSVSSETIEGSKGTFF